MILFFREMENINNYTQYAHRRKWGRRFLAWGKHKPCPASGCIKLRGFISQVPSFQLCTACCLCDLVDMGFSHVTSSAVSHSLKWAPGAIGSANRNCYLRSEL